MRLAAVAAVLGLVVTGCAPLGSLPPAAARPEWQSVEFDTNSWGRVVTGWSVAADGKGGWWERVGADGRPALAPTGTYRLVYHALDAGPQGFARLAALLADLPDPQPLAARCTNFRTDDLYGTLQLRQAASFEEIAWNRGCRDSEYMAFMARLDAADALVAGWGRAAPVARIVHYDANGLPAREEVP